MQYIEIIKTESSLSAKPVHAAVLLALCTLGATEVEATCTGVTTSTTVTCVSPTSDIGATTQQINGSGNINVTLTDWIMSNGSLDLKATNGNIALMGTGVTITNGTNVGDGVIHMAATKAGSSVLIDIKDSTLSGTNNVQGIAAHAVNSTGNTQVKTNNVRLNMGVSTVNSGINSYVSGSGTATIDMTESVLNVASNIMAINGYSATGSVDITTRGGSVTSTGNGYGIQGTLGAGSGSVLIHNGSTLSTVAAGIYTKAFTGLTDITNTGAITTSGVNAHGISATSTDGAINIANSARIEARSTASTGIRGQATGSGNIDITNSGQIITNGGGTSDGIYAQAGTGNITIGQSGTINIIGINNITQGIYALGKGNVTVNMTGGNITNNSATNGTHAIEARANGSGTASINLMGGTVSSNGGVGLFAWYGNAPTATGSLEITTAADTRVSSTTRAGISASDTTDTTSATAASGAHTWVNSQSIITAGGEGILAVSVKDAPVSVKQTGGSITSVKSGIRTSTAGKIDVANTGAITTTGANAHGILATSTNGSVSIKGDGRIETHGANADGILATTTTGAVTVDYNGVLLLSGGNTSEYAGIRSIVSSGTGNSSITYDGPSIDIIGTNSGAGQGVFGIFGTTRGSGNSSVTAAGNISSKVEGTGLHAEGIESIATGGGDAFAHYTGGTITVTGSTNNSGQSTGITSWTGGSATGSASLITDAGTRIDVTGNNPYGVFASSAGTAAANKTIHIDTASTINVTGANARGVYANGTSTAPIDVTYSGPLLMANGTGAVGIWATSSGGNINVNSIGDIDITGDQGHGINSVTTGKIDISTSGAITTSGDGSQGIYASGSTDVKIISDGDIHLTGTASRGILSVSGAGSTINITNNSTIRHNAASTQQYGIEARGDSNNSITINNNGQIEGAEFGIVAWTDFVPHTGSTSTLNIGNQGVVDALYAISADMSDSNTINIADGGLVNGKVFALNLRSQGTATPLFTVNNAGSITSERDHILRTQLAIPGATIAINNQTSGVMTGYMLAENANVSVNNSGLWNLRNLADTDSDLLRDTLTVAVSDFGHTGNNSISNSGILALLGDDGIATILNNASEYSTGYAANAMTLGGATQGQILGVQTFTNSGVIDLSANSSVGDVLLISGSNTAGTAGGGVYITDGGQIKVDTILNEGGLAHSQSDMLVVDGTRLGSGATSIMVNNVGGAGANTVDNGIEVVRVLDSASSESGIFKLGARTTAGLYEYDLFKGAVDANATDGNWYLRTLKTPDNIPVINPESTVYLRNLNAASTMFMHTLHDRLGEPQFTDPYKTDGNNPSSAWVRVVSNHTDSVGGNGQVDLNTDTNLVHLGTDIARWSNDGNDRWIVGVMGAYGQSKIDASAKYFAVTPSGFERNATGKVDGYSVGAYATWYGNKDKPEGAYVDTWAQYGWYDNKVQGNTKAEENYNSRGWTASVEAGYAMIAREEGNGRQLMFEPQIQVAYNNFTSDDHTDAGGTRVTDNNANGVITRVGARLYARSTQNDNGIQPFVEANWWYSDAKNSLTFNGQTMSDGTPNSRYELKAGLQGEVAKNWLMWGHAGVQFGENDFNRYEGMVGIKRMF